MRWSKYDHVNVFSLFFWSISVMLLLSACSFAPSMPITPETEDGNGEQNPSQTSLAIPATTMSPQSLDTPATTQPREAQTGVVVVLSTPNTTSTTMATPSGTSESDEEDSEPSNTPTMTPTEEDEDATDTPTPTRTPSPTEEPSETPTDETDDTLATPTLDPRPVVPFLIGVQETTAQNRLLSLDARVEIAIEYQSTLCRNAGEVIETSPIAGNPIDPGSTVVLVVCDVPEAEVLPTMPYVIGLQVQAARDSLDQVGLGQNVEVVGQIASCSQDSEVLSTNPAAGVMVSPGSKIVLTICIQPTPTLPPADPTPQVVPSGQVMPALIGLHPDVARKELQAIDLVASFQQVNNSCEDQMVVGTIPAAGDPVDENTTIIIDVCAPLPDN